MKNTILGMALAAMLTPAIASASNTLLFNKQWSYAHLEPGFASEISAFDATTGTIWTAGVSGVDILDVMTGNQVGFINTSAFGEINSIDIHNGTAAFALQNQVRTNNGTVAFYDTSTRSFQTSVQVGALPDMVKFTPDGSKVLVANEGTPDVYGSEIKSSPTKQFGPAPNDPEGSVSIIDRNNGNSVQTANFNGVPVNGSGVRTNVGMDFEPEYIGINAAGTKAFVTIQEHNAIGILDINSASFTEVVGLGTKDFSASGNEIDPSDKDGGINFASHNVKGFYMPDAVDTYEVNGQTFLVMANEGDFREDDGDRTRAKDIGDGASAPLDRLRVDNTNSVVDNGTNQQDLFAPGGRSFSIRDANGNMVYDSGSILDRAAAAAAGIYDDNRSDDKGTEPESVEIYEINGKTYAFIGLERTTSSAIGIFDITNPLNVAFDQLLTIPGDVSPEGLQVFDYLGTTYLSVANEVSNTTSLLAITAVPEPQTYAMLLAGLALVRFAQRKKQA